MPDSRTPATELETVNAVLASVGESPVDALGVDFVDAVIASNLLLEESPLTHGLYWPVSAR